MSHSTFIRWIGFAAFAAVPALFAVAPTTMHQDDAGGDSNTVTLHLRSRTVLDRGLLRRLGAVPQIPDEQRWQHGHSGPQLLRVINPARTCKIFGGGRYYRKETGSTMVCDTDVIKIEVVVAPAPAPNCDPKLGNCYAAGALSGMSKVADLVITRRQIPNVGAFTNGHLFGDLSGPADSCIGKLTDASRPDSTPYIDAVAAVLLRALNPAAGSSSTECLKREVMRNIASASGSGSAADLDTTWVFKMEDGAGFKWHELDPEMSNGPNTVVASVVTTNNKGKSAEIMTEAVLKPHKAEEAATFDFRLQRNGDEKLLFRDLRVYSAGSSTPRFKRRINPGGMFRICKNNEQTGQPDCAVIPDLQKTLKVPEPKCCNTGKIPVGHH